MMVHSQTTLRVRAFAPSLPETFCPLFPCTLSKLAMCIRRCRAFTAFTAFNSYHLVYVAVVGCLHFLRSYHAQALCHTISGLSTPPMQWNTASRLKCRALMPQLRSCNQFPSVLLAEGDSCGIAPRSPSQFRPRLLYCPCTVLPVLSIPKGSAPGFTLILLHCRALVWNSCFHSFGEKESRVMPEADVAIEAHSAGWTKGGAAPKDGTISMTFAVKQQNLELLTETLLKVSDPRHKA